MMISKKVRFANAVARIIGKIFYKKEYLTSRYFYEYKYGADWIFKGLFWQKIMRENAHVPWPVSRFNTVNGPYENLVFDAENIDNFQGKGVLFQCSAAKIYIGSNTIIANNVGLITANHDPENVQAHVSGKEIFIGKNCWLGMNSMILPGVRLGDNTIVGAGAVVTKSFEGGNCVVAGNPAKIIKSYESVGGAE